jgi:hypothetical protein
MSGTFLPADAGMQGLPRDLLDVCRRLRLSVQVVGDDAVSAAAFGGRWTPDNQMPARLEGPVLQDALKNVLVDGADRLLEFGDVTVALAPIPKADRATNGAVLLAGRASSGFPELATLATWFAAAFSRSGVISSAGVEIRRLASLVAILDRAAASNSESEIVRAFVEALAVWTDREAWGYLGDVSGEFALHVTLPGSAISRVPVALDKAAIPDGSRFFIVLPDAADEVSVGCQDPVFLARVRVSAGSDWLIATRGELSASEKERFLLFCYVLGVALASLAAIDQSRLTWALFDAFALGESDAFETGAEKGVAALEAVLGVPASLVLAQDDEEPVLAAGSLPRQPSLEGALVVPVSLASAWDAALTVGKPHDRPLTKRDEELARSAAQAFSIWLKTVITSPSFTPERRPRTPDAPAAPVHDAPADEAHEAAVIVVSPPGRARSVDDFRDARIWQADIQRRVRPDDVVARLPTGDFGILLSDTTSDGTRAVVTRLRRAFASDWGPGGSVSISTAYPMGIPGALVPPVSFSMTGLSDGLG